MYEDIAPATCLPYLTIEEISHILKRKFAQLNLKDSDKDHLIDKAVHIFSGMSKPELIWGIDNITNSLKNDNTVSAYIDGLLEYKKQKLKNLGLNFLPKTNLGEIGGMDVLKQYIDKLEVEFAADARRYNIPIPQGWALVGVPGSGKSFSAKILAQKLSLPMIHLPIEEVKTRGSQYLAKILKLVEANAPNILFLDELEKIFPGEEKLDSETATTLGVFLTWLQEKKAPCFVLATLNRLDTLPPELIRAGRFSEVFYAGFPQPIERKEIFRLHLKSYDARYQEDILSTEQWRELIDQTINFTGAEIAQVVEKAYRQKYLERVKAKKTLETKLYEYSDGLIPLIESGYEQQILKIQQNTINFSQLDRDISKIMAELPEIAETIDELYGQLITLNKNLKQSSHAEVKQIQQSLNKIVNQEQIDIIRQINQKTINLDNLDAKVSQAMSDLPELAPKIDLIYLHLCKIRELIQEFATKPLAIDYKTLLRYAESEIPLYERNVDKVMAI